MNEVIYVDATLYPTMETGIARAKEYLLHYDGIHDAHVIDTLLCFGYWRIELAIDREDI